MTSARANTFPQTVEVGGNTYTLRLMTPADGGRILAFARSLPVHDLLFLRRDITSPAEVELWMDEIERGNTQTILALLGDELVGYSSVARNTLNWMRHVAELRVLVAADHRRGGLGRMLTTAAFRLAVDMGVEKMLAQMTVDQEGAIGVFYRLGFEEEARLRAHVKDRDGKTYDIVLLSQDVSEYQVARQQREGASG
jgi:L-amino acid N-acyltransferase YncA